MLANLQGVTGQGLTVKPASLIVNHFGPFFTWKALCECTWCCVSYQYVSWIMISISNENEQMQTSVQNIFLILVHSVNRLCLGKLCDDEMKRKPFLSLQGFKEHRQLS